MRRSNIGLSHGVLSPEQRPRPLRGADPDEYLENVPPVRESARSPDVRRGRRAIAALRRLFRKPASL